MNIFYQSSRVSEVPLFNLDLKLNLINTDVRDHPNPTEVIERICSENKYASAFQIQNRWMRGIEVANSMLGRPMYSRQDGILEEGHKEGIETRTADISLHRNTSGLLLLKAFKDRGGHPEKVYERVRVDFYTEHDVTEDYLEVLGDKLYLRMVRAEWLKSKGHKVPGVSPVDWEIEKGGLLSKVL